MVARFEQAFAKKAGAAFAVARNSCMTALARQHQQGSGGLRSSARPHRRLCRRVGDVLHDESLPQVRNLREALV